MRHVQHGEVRRGAPEANRLVCACVHARAASAWAPALQRGGAFAEGRRTVWRSRWVCSHRQPWVWGREPQVCGREPQQRIGRILATDSRLDFVGLRQKARSVAGASAAFLVSGDFQSRLKFLFLPVVWRLGWRLRGKEPSSRVVGLGLVPTKNFQTTPIGKSKIEQQVPRLDFSRDYNSHRVFAPEFQSRLTRRDWISVMDFVFFSTKSTVASQSREFFL